LVAPLRFVAEPASERLTQPSVTVALQTG
jgi:hypothetical protein